MLVTEEELEELLARNQVFSTEAFRHQEKEIAKKPQVVIIESPIFDIFKARLVGFPFVKRAGLFLPLFKPLTERENREGIVDGRSQLRFVHINGGVNFNSLLKGLAWEIERLNRENDLLEQYKLTLGLIESVLSSIKLSKPNGFTTEVRTLSLAIRKNDEDKDFPKTAMKENLKILARSLFFTFALSPASYLDDRFYCGAISFNLSWWLWLLSDLQDKQNEILNKRLLAQLKKFTQEDLDKFSSGTFKLQEN